MVFDARFDLCTVHVQRLADLLPRLFDSILGYLSVACGDVDGGALFREVNCRFEADALGSSRF
jgi:hypothetical protein